MMSRRAVLNVPRTISSSLSTSRPAVSHHTTSFLRPAAAQQAQRQYHQNVIDHYENPRNVGSLDKNAIDVGTGMLRHFLPAGS